MGGWFSGPWRTYATTYEDDLTFVKSYRPQNREVQHLRILLHGPICAGKSSFINSVDSALQGRITGRASADTLGQSFTKKYRAYKINRNTGGHYSFIFNDIMGFERWENNGVQVEDVKLALRGHVKDGCQVHLSKWKILHHGGGEMTSGLTKARGDEEAKFNFKPDHQMTINDPYYEPAPTLDDRVHVLVFVVSANLIYTISNEVVKKMREVRLAASDMGVPQLVILTKIDEACPEVKKDINNAYYNEYLKGKVKDFSDNLGIPENCIFLVKNYNTEGRTNRGIDTLILRALRQMISFGDDYLNDV